MSFLREGTGFTTICTGKITPVRYIAKVSKQVFMILSFPVLKYVSKNI